MDERRVDDRRVNREILEIRNLTVSFIQYEKNTFHKSVLPVISDLGITVREGEITAVIGSSGSGKSVLAHALFGLLPQNASVNGSISYLGKPLRPGMAARLRGREIALIPQGVNCLDPLMKTGKQILNGKKDRLSVLRMRELLGKYGLTREAERQYPSELSGGMARRVLLITALMNRPKLIVADEPTAGMEEALAKKAFADFRDFADTENGVLLITHDLRMALTVADRIVVLYAGTVVEDASADDFAEERLLRHPYTKALWRAMPEHGFSAEPGVQPYVSDLKRGCLFAPRCPDRREACGGEIPMVLVREGMARCVRCEEIYESARQEGGE